MISDSQFPLRTDQDSGSRKSHFRIADSGSDIEMIADRALTAQRDIDSRCSYGGEILAESYSIGEKNKSRANRPKKGRGTEMEHFQYFAEARQAVGTDHWFWRVEVGIIDGEESAMFKHIRLDLVWKRGGGRQGR